MAKVAEPDERTRQAVSLWIRLARCHSKILRQLRDFGEHANMTMAQFDALAQLARHPQGMTAGALAEALLVTAGNVTGLAEKLAERGLLKRRPHPTDGRVRVLVLTPAGRRLAHREISRHEQKIARLFDELGDRGLQRMLKDLEHLDQMLDARAVICQEVAMSTCPLEIAGFGRAKHFLLNLEAGVLTITLNRPERLNALTFEVYDELRRLFYALDQVPEIRAAVITGTGKGFCSGGDVESIIGALFERDYQGLLEFTRMTCDLIAAMRRYRRPIIAALNGTTAGAGAMIACAADLRIAVPSAKIAFLFTRVGLSGADMGAAWLLPRLIGQGRATQLLMTGEFVEPSQALAMGLYNRVVTGENLMVEVQSQAEALARGPAFGLEMTKDLLNREASMDLWNALETEAQAQAQCMQHADFREAYEAFVAKRPPRFSGAPLASG